MPPGRPITASSNQFAKQSVLSSLFSQGWQPQLEKYRKPGEATAPPQATGGRPGRLPLAQRRDRSTPSYLLQVRCTSICSAGLARKSPINISNQPQSSLGPAVNQTLRVARESGSVPSRRTHRREADHRSAHAGRPGVVSFLSSGGEGPFVQRHQVRALNSGVCRDPSVEQMQVLNPRNTLSQLTHSALTTCWYFPKAVRSAHAVALAASQPDRARFVRLVGGRAAAAAAAATSFADAAGSLTRGRFAAGGTATPAAVSAASSCFTRSLSFAAATVIPSFFRRIVSIVRLVCARFVRAVSCLAM